MKPSSNHSSRRVASSSESQGTRASIERYDQSRFVPSRREIEKYYYPSGVFYAQSSASQGVPFVAAPGSANSVAGPIGRDGSVGDGVSYRENNGAQAFSFAASTPVNTGNPTTSGTAFISPIVHADASLSTKRFGDPSPDSFGVTRPFSRANEVSQVSYAERRPTVANVRMNPDALFGWSSETSAVLPDLGAPEAGRSGLASSETIDSEKVSFIDALGRPYDFSWLESSSGSQSGKRAVSQLSDSFNDSKNKTTERRFFEETSSFDDVETRRDAVKRIEEEPRIVADAGASLDDVFDSVVFSGGKRSSSSLSNDSFDASSQASVPAGDVSASVSELSRASRDAAPTDRDDRAYSKDENDGLSYSEAPLVQQASPLEKIASLRERPPLESTNTNVASSPIPETVVERSGRNLDSPLTNEEIAWVNQIKNAIQGLLNERESLASRGVDTRSCDAKLRLLYLTIGEYDRSIQNIQDDADPLKAFWEKECRGLETLLQNRLEEIDPSFVAERLSSGLDSLSSFCDVKIRKALLVNAPACYGLYEERQRAYSQGESIHAYMELDYVASRESVKGYSIDVECRWRLVDSYGNVVVPFESQRCSNVSETKLRDVVLNVSVPLPKRTAPGDYSLELEVVDLNAKEPKTSIKRLNLTVFGVTEG